MVLTTGVPRPVIDFSRLMNPRAIAVVGASNDFSRIGGQPLRLLTEYGYQGGVYPVNPKYSEIKGMRCYPDLASVPQPCDVALVVLSARHVPDVISQCGAVRIPFAVVLSSGFGEVGGEGEGLQEALLAAAQAGSVRLIGPNCLGTLNLKDNVRNGFGGTSLMKTLIPGPYAMVTQSGGFGFGIVAIAAYYGVGFNYAISTGNEVDVSTLDLLEYFLERSDVEAVVTFMEGIDDGRRLLAIGERALELGKPILVWKVGNSDVGSQAAASHTARMTSGYELFRTVFDHSGFIEVQDIDELIDTLKILRSRKLPRSNRVCVISPSGGSGVVLADQCSAHGLELPPLADATVSAIREFVVAFASVANPIDATAHGHNDNFASYNRLIATVLADPEIDQVIVRAPRGPSAAAWSRGLVETADTTDKPILINWPTSPDDNRDVMQFLEDNGHACILAPRRAARALANITDYARKKREHERRPQLPLARSVAELPLDLAAATGALDEYRSKAGLRVYGIPAVREVMLALDAVQTLKESPLAFPVAVKILSPDILHKTEADCVRLNVGSLQALQAAALEVVSAARKYKSDASIEGILVQEMGSGLEAIAGAVNDRFFGPVVVFGLGGVYTELMKGTTRRLAPFDVDAAKEMISEIKGHAIFHGFRGQPALDVEALAEALSRLSWLIADHADRIAEIDINPLFVRPRGQGVVAADAVFVLK